MMHFMDSGDVGLGLGAEAVRHQPHELSTRPPRRHVGFGNNHAEREGYDIPF